jgi:hypothetical protein
MPQLLLYRLCGCKLSCPETCQVPRQILVLTHYILFQPTAGRPSPCCLYPSSR